MGVSRPVGRVLCPACAGRRSSIWDCRCRQPRAVYPRASGGPPSIARAGNRGSPLDLAPGGVYRAAAVTCGAGGLLHHRFTLTPALARGRSVFCGTVPRVTPGRRYRPPCPVEPGPSSPGLRPARPPGRLTHAQDTPGAHRAGAFDRADADERRERFDRRRHRAGAEPAGSSSAAPSVTSLLAVRTVRQPNVALCRAERRDVPA